MLILRCTFPILRPHVRTSIDTLVLRRPLDLTPAGKESSRMFSDAPAAVMTTLTTLNSTMNFHHDGVDTGGTSLQCTTTTITG